MGAEKVAEVDEGRYYITRLHCAHILWPLLTRGGGGEEVGNSSGDVSTRHHCCCVCMLWWWNGCSYSGFDMRLRTDNFWVQEQMYEGH